MEKVCESWKESFPAGKIGAQYFADFQTRAQAAAAEIFRVKTAADAKDIIAEIAKSTGAKKIVTVDSPLQQASGVIDELKSMGLDSYTGPLDIAEHAESADIGISSVEFGIAESGSVCMDGYAIEHRLVSMLPPIHIVFLNSNYIVPGINEAFEVISKVFNRGYISFITGPSRTADIERVLTIGVHGPSRFIIIAVDEEIN